MADRIGLEAIFDLSGWSRNFKAYISDIDHANSKTLSFTDSISKIGQITLAAVGASIAAVGAAISGFTYMSVKDAISVESAFAGVVKTTDGLADQFGNLTPLGLRLKDMFRDLAKEIPLSTEELMKIGEIGGQLGIAEDKLIDFTKTVAAMGVSTDMSTEDAAFSFAMLTNVMGLTQDQFDEIGSAVVRLGNTSNTTESRIMNFASKMAGAAKVAGLSVADVLGISAAFSSVGAEAQAGGTATQKVLLNITKAVATNSSELQVWANTAGVSVNDFVDMWETKPAAAFAAFVTGLGEQGDQAFQTLDTLGIADQRLMREFLKLGNAGDLLINKIDESNMAYEENTALTWEAGQRYATTESQLIMLKNTVRDLGVEFGTALLPAIKTVVGVFRDFIEKNGPSIEQFFTTVGGLVSNFTKAFVETEDPVLAVKYALYEMLPPDMAAQMSDIVDKIVEFKDRAMEIIAPIAEWISKNVELKDVLITLGIMAAVAIAPAVWAFLQLAGTFALVLAAVTALRHAWETNFLGIRDFFTAVWENIKLVFEAISAAFKGDWETAGEKLKEAWGRTWEVMKDIFSKIWNKVKEIAIGVWKDISPKLKEWWETIKANAIEKWESIKTFFAETFENIKTSVITKWEEIKTSIAEKIEGMQTAIEEFGNGIKESVLGYFEDLRNGAIEKWENIKASIVGKLRELFAAMGLDFDEYVERWREIWERVKVVAEAAWESIKAAISEKLKSFLEPIEAAWKTISDSLETAWNTIKETVLSAWDTIKTSILSKWEEISSGTKEKVEEIKKDISEKWEEIKDNALTKWNEFKENVINPLTETVLVVTEKINEIKKVISETFMEVKADVIEKWEEIKTSINQKVQEILDAITGKIEDFKNLGRNMIQGLKDGILESIGDVIASVTKVVEDALTAAERALLIDSPSKVFKMKIGKNISLGIAEGIDTYRKTPIAIMQNLSSDIASVPMQPNISTTNNYNNNRNVNIEINPSYASYQSPASLYFDVVSAIGRI